MICSLLSNKFLLFHLSAWKRAYHKGCATPFSFLIKSYFSPLKALMVFVSLSRASTIFTLAEDILPARL